MAIKRWLVASLCGMAMLFLSVCPVSAAIKTMPEIPDLTGEPIKEQITQSPASEPEQTEPVLPTDTQDDNRMLVIGVASWIAFFVIAGIVAIIIVRVKKNPPGGAAPNSKGKLGRPTSDTEAYKERMLSDQHYRKY